MWEAVSCRLRINGGLKVIVNGSDGTQTMLPLDSFVSDSQKGGTQQ